MMEALYTYLSKEPSRYKLGNNLTRGVKML